MRKKTVLAVSVVVVTAISVIFLPSVFWTQFVGGSECSSVPTTSPATPGRVALVDQLSEHFPNPGFVENVNSSAIQAGQSLEYYPPRAVTLDFFVNLPQGEYSIVILRTHGRGVDLEGPPVIATSDRYSQYRRVGDQLLDRVTSMEVDGSRYFALMPSFITDVMCGRFSGTLVLVMGCAGASWPALGNAFIEKGAGAYVGWDLSVTVSHTDLAFEVLVDLLLKGGTIADSVQAVMETFGPDGSTGARLVYYSA